MQTLLLVDDDTYLRDSLAKAFSRRGYPVLTAGDYDEAITLISEKSPSLAVIDLKMPGKNGLELLEDGLAVNPDMRAVVLTGYGSIATATEAIKMGAIHYLAKPVDVDDIIRVFSGSRDADIQAGDEEITTPTLARVEWEHINRVLTDCNNNISKAAKQLGLHRRTLQRKLYKYAPK